MKYNNTITLFTIAFFMLLGVTAQEKELKKANEEYQNSAYKDAAKAYLKVVKSGNESSEVLLKLGNAYYFNADYSKAATWYEKLYSTKDAQEDQSYLLRYSQSLRAIGEKQQAEKIYNEFLKVSGSLDKNLKNSEDYLNIIELNSNRYKLDSLEMINSKYMDYGAFLRNDTLYFSSARNTRTSIGRIDAWDNERFLDIYTAVLDPKTNHYSKPKQLKGAVNSKYHESSAVVTKDGKTMYFTKSNNTPLDKNSKIARLKIYRATKGANGNWGNIEDLTINGDSYSTAHPALSPNEKILYYVSDMPGSYGETDIYSVDIYNQGTLGKPKNLGPKVNTKGRESFPFITSKYELYFSSDGHFGLGGYDVFYFDLASRRQQLINVGKPINSSKDDYAFSINNANKKGFLSSDRSGVDNIYKFTEIIPIREVIEYDLEGVIIDQETNKPIAGVVVTVTDTDGKIQSKGVTDANGKFSLRVSKFKPNILKAENDNYVFTDKFIPEQYDGGNIRLELKKKKVEVKNDEDFKRILNTRIYYDYNKANIRKDAIAKLEKLIEFLQKHREVSLEIKSYADSRGRPEYNLKLSDKRTQKVIEFIEKRGVNKSRLIGKGYGETEPVIDCQYPKKCSQKEYQLNRRTEFQIIKKQKK
ncbi:OmpA family protein [Tenacibaculum aiptasiae]|uniref:OmpA family protein n=1 Tax=Tenacibaculum aiptasiae TaxID=426481 RepID=A0A7J5AI60_9FLAO|nr:OmpA family protein [Tenacibaculum aiptasiae]KAB1157302.1 OmpA family protein [Tenacibaculum aiptasiae]